MIIFKLERWLIDRAETKNDFARGACPKSSYKLDIRPYRLGWPPKWSHFKPENNRGLLKINKT